MRTALEQTNNDLPNIGYAAVPPIAPITNVMLVQRLFTLLACGMRVDKKWSDDRVHYHALATGRNV